MNQSLLIVEDDESTAAFLTDNLVADGYRVAVASGAAEGIRQIEVRQPTLVLLDLTLDDGSGLALLDRVRSSDGMTSRVDPDLPVIVISGRGGHADRVRSFDRGADDHVQKPLFYGELLGRIRAVLRRTQSRRRSGVVRYGGLSLDPVTRAVCLEGVPVRVSGMEFALLQRLAAEPERVYTKNELLRDVWGYQALGKTRTVDAHACRLRRKLDVVASERRWVVNVRGIGYRLTDPVR
jgi:DNA-binding response OmpR family regulator